tara:strand:- start:84 stop:707 length:624 start_codon:yes stop_codon:yes gene_type:complete
MGFLKQITEKPWLPPEENGVSEIKSGTAVLGTPPQRIALRLFLAVAVTLFGLFSVAYYVRMELDDWRALAEPNLLWTNTGIIILSSVAFQIATWAVQRNKKQLFQLSFASAGILTIVFLVSQYAAWQELTEAGYYAVVNPANAFFYVLTGVHGLHLLGGLAVWAKTLLRVAQGAEAYKVKLSIELCTTYWHFLALVWLVILWILIST